jgi:plastocyanin
MDNKKNKFIKENLTAIQPDNCDLRVGDLVEWVNDYGVVWTHKILGFCYDGWYNKKYQKYVHLDTESYWFAHDHLKLKKI